MCVYVSELVCSTARINIVNQLCVCVYAHVCVCVSRSVMSDFL